MTSETEVRSLSRPTQRQSGFNIGNQHINGHESKTNGSVNGDSGRFRTTTGDTIVGTSLDNDIEMGEDKRSVIPLPIPRLGQETKPPIVEGGKTAAQAGSQGRSASGLSNEVKLPTLHSSLLSPRMTTISSSHVSSGPASLSSAQWSPGRSSDPHLYSISGQPYSNASVRPYLSTSFQTSAERGAGPSRTAQRSRTSGVDLDDDEDDDVFGNPSQSLGLHNAEEPSPPQLRRSSEMDREDGDAAGVFSFSSPYFGPRSLDASDIPPLSPPPTHAGRGPLNRVMSPSWTAASLGKLSLGGPSSDANSTASAARPPFGVSPQSNGHSASAAYSRSLPSAANGFSHHPPNRRPQPGPGMLHPHASYQHRPTANRSRSSSRHRGDRGSQRILEHVEDDDETDEDELMPSREQDDDATEDEAEPQARARYVPNKNGTSRFVPRPDEGHYASTAAQPHRHPSGQTTTMSASYDRAQSGLSRQYSSDRYAHLAMSRHHPYALSPSGASPSNAGILSSYSPSNPRGPLGRRRSSFGNGNVLSGSPSNGMMHALSHSPRYIQSIPTRDRPPMSTYSSGEHGSYVGGNHSVGSAYTFGESPDGSAFTRHYHAQEDVEEDEEDEEDNDEDRTRRPMARSSKPSARSTSATRSSAHGLTGEVESAEMTEVNGIRERLGGAANCSAFISKLWYLMCRPELYQKYIHWSESGDSVILSNDPDINNEFAAEVLPKLFKHGNNASFVRQLNLYGFQRVPSSRLLDAAEIKAARRYANGTNISTALQLYGPHSSFAHPRFKKDQESLLPSMKPRSSKKTKKGGGQGDTSANGGGRAGAESDGEEDFAL